MPRSINRSFYHYKVIFNDTNETKLYRTCQDICKEFNICRATIYNMINHESKRSRKRHNITIQQFYQPIE
jgi:hypothetical protein